MRRLLLRVASIRPLPLAIVTMALLVVVKLAALVQGPGSPAVLAVAGRAVLPAAAAHDAPAPAAKPAEVPAPPKGPLPPSNAPASIVDVSKDVPAAPPVSEAERGLLQDLRARRVALDARAQALETREGLLAAAEKRFSERVEQLTAMQTRLEALEQTRRERDEANWRSLVKTYETMRPRDAATIFNDLDQAVLIQVLDRMKEAKAAQILGAMTPERARAATAQLAQWRLRVPTSMPAAAPGSQG